MCVTIVAQYGDPKSREREQDSGFRFFGCSVFGDFKLGLALANECIIGRTFILPAYSLYAHRFIMWPKRPQTADGRRQPTVSLSKPNAGSQKILQHAGDQKRGCRVAKARSRVKASPPILAAWDPADITGHWLELVAVWPLQRLRTRRCHLDAAAQTGNWQIQLARTADGPKTGLPIAHCRAGKKQKKYKSELVI